MLIHFRNNIKEKNLFTPENKLLLAFSGGIDSVVLAHLLLKAGYLFELVHCNFNLRGKESDTDEKFCVDFAHKIKVKIHVKQFDTRSYMKIKKLSVQMAARELRYRLFKELTLHHHFDFILTAHHASDNVETLLINLIRGTGLHGLQGIPEKQNNIIRPLLFASKEEIYNYAIKNKLKFRHDSSNDEKKYARNLLRHDVIPVLKKLNPSLETTFASNICLFKQSWEVINEFCEQKKKEMVKQKNTQLNISIQQLIRENAADLLLHEWLSPLGFNPTQTRQIYSCLPQHLPGKKFTSKTHRLLIDRTAILIEPLQAFTENHNYLIRTKNDFKKIPLFSKSEILDSCPIDSDSTTGLFNYGKIQFPLTIRSWEKGDKFTPLGMKGTKKISDYLIGLKMPLFEKNKVLVLVNADKEIIWLIGLRISEKFKISTGKKVLKLVIH